MSEIGRPTPRPPSIVLIYFRVRLRNIFLESVKSPNHCLSKINNETDNTICFDDFKTSIFEIIPKMTNE